MRFDLTRLKEMKTRGEKIVMLTAYDYITARAIEHAGIPLILVGDSLGMVVLGYDSTLPVTMDDVLHHTRAVVRGSSTAAVIADMPFMSYQISVEDALYNAGRLIQEGGAQAVKIEGGSRLADRVEAMSGCGIPVMGHIGLTPQSIYQLGGFKAQGKTREAAKRLLEDALAIESAGAFAIVLETIPAALAGVITRRLKIPTIGIGAGPQCDGQVQVVNDILGLTTGFLPRHAKAYTHFSEEMADAFSRYHDEVTRQEFPTAKESIAIDSEILEGL